MAGDRLNVLFSSWNFPPRRGGIEEMVRQLLDHLSELDDVVLLTSHAEDDEAAGGNVVRSPLRGLMGYLVWLLSRLALEARRRPETVLLSSGALVGSWVQVANLLLRRPHAVLVFGSDITHPNRLYQLWLRALLPRVSVVVSISRSTRDEILSRGLSEPGRVLVLPPGVDPRMISLPVAVVPQTASPVLLFVGRVIARKGLRPFLENAFPSILRETDAELWVIGGEASDSLAHRSGELAGLRGWLQDQPIASKVRLLGEVSDEVKRAAFKRCSVLVLPAVSVPGDVEGFGIVFLEAALFGAPAVSTTLGGIPDAVVDGETGILVEAGDWQAFADAVIRLLQDPDLHSRLATQARRRASEDLSWPRLARRYHEVLAGVGRGSTWDDGKLV